MTNETLSVALDNSKNKNEIPNEFKQSQGIVLFELIDKTSDLINRLHFDRNCVMVSLPLTHSTADPTTLLSG